MRRGCAGAFVAFSIAVGCVVASCRGASSTRSSPDVAPSAARVPGSPFVCDGQSCVQRYPALPDSGEWECAEIDGVAYCRGGERAAGVYRRDERPVAPWVCGARRSVPQERVCVDVEPEVPREQASAWRCQYGYEGGIIKRCVADRSTLRRGSRCQTDAGGCPHTLRCIGGRCEAPEPKPDCWLDADCVSPSVCALGTCTREEVAR